MKTLSNLLIAGFLAIGLFACSNDDPITEEGTTQPGETVYMQVKLSLPTATRSKTDDEGSSNSNANEDIEIGYDVENSISSLQMLLTDAQNNVIAYSKVSESNEFNVGQGTPKYTVVFNSADLVGHAGDSINIFVFCNPYAGISYDNVDATFNINEDNAAIWQNNQFFMTNSELKKSGLPAKEEIERHTTPDNPLNIGTVKVERAAARFDYTAKAPADQTFWFDVTTDMKNVGVQLTDMALFNLSKACYNIRRVSATGTNTDWDICGKETVDNYVVDTDYDNKAVDNLLYNSDAFSDVTNLSWTKIVDLKKPDQWNDNTNTEPKPEYYIWRYAMENTIPANVSQNKNIATGVLFKGEMVAGTDLADSLKTTIEAGTAPIYVFDNILYGSWDQLSEYVNAEGADLNVKLKYNKVAAGDSTATARIATAREEGFKVYEPVNQKYIMYYYYWNRHNDDEIAEDDAEFNGSGPMEFAVVRNNVYKLHVEKVSGFGDDVPDLPNEPIEKKEVYFEVTVEILPWVVRVNNIVLGD